ncbi:MAG: hypothetical protein QOF24_393 [Verrucomicrobiota bacterium]|jgi:hypothetical protein
MKIDMRRQLARQPFEVKIRKVGQLIKLSATMKSSRVREEAQMTQPPSRTPDPFQGRVSKASSDPVS